MQKAQEVIYFDKEPDTNIFKRIMFIPENIKILKCSMTIEDKTWDLEICNKSN